MIDILETRSGKVFPTTEALCIKEFKKIWDQDTTEHKTEAEKHFRYINLLCNPGSPYRSYSEDEKPEKVQRAIEGFRPTKDTNAAVEVYKELLMNADPLYVVFNSAKTALYAVKDYFDTVQVSKPTDATNLIASLSKVGDLFKSFSALEKQVSEKLYEGRKTKANRQINPFEE